VAGENLEEHRKTLADQMKGEMTRTMRSRASKFNPTRTSSTLGDFRSGISMTPKENAWFKEDLTPASSTLTKSKGPTAGL
jgi:hypothetical protein